MAYKCMARMANVAFTGEALILSPVIIRQRRAHESRIGGIP
jgi:hypothetical protein